MATLDDLVSNLGIGVLDIAAAPAGVDVEVGDLVIHDPSDQAVDAGALVLGVGLDPAARSSADAIVRFAAAGAIGVVVRGDPAPLVDVARSSGIALLAVPTEMAWAQLHTLLRTARAAAGQVGDAATGAPVGDLFALANAVAAMVGGPATIEDMQSTVLAYSSLDEPIDEARRDTILGHRIPDDWVVRLRDDGIFRRLYTSRDAITIDYRDTIPGFNTRLAVAVRAGDEVLGSIWVADAKQQGFGPEAEAAIKEAAELAALHLLRSQAAGDIERRRRSELLRAALEGRAAPEALRAAVDLAPAMAFTTVAFELLGDGSDQATTTVVAERAVNLIALHCEAYRRQALAVAIGPVVHVLLPETAAPDRTKLTRFLGDLVGRTTDALRVDMRVAVGATVDGIGGLVRSHREALRVLRAMRDVASAPGTVASVDDLRSHIVLLELQDVANREPELREGKVADLAALDATKQTAYIETLRAYLDHFGDVPAAADAIGVHPNTFRYRLRRLVELADLNLDDPAERLVAQLQLRLLRAPESP